MAKSLTKTAGMWEVRVYTDGFPPSVVITDTSSSKNPCEMTTIRTDPEGMADLLHLLERARLFLSEGDKG